MKFKVIASGSKGNVTLLRVNDKVYIIDVGISYSRVKSLLNMYQVNNIDGVFITHRHSDHVRGLNVLGKREQTSIYISQGTFSELRESDFTPIIIEPYQHIILDDLVVIPLEVSHDTDTPLGFVFLHDGKKLVYITDTGYISSKNLDYIKDADAYIIESNHNVEMLMKNPKYPWRLRKRIISDYGHLSNEQCGVYLRELIGNNTKYVVLAHLSEENNTEECALETVSSILMDDNIELSAASQLGGSKVYEI